MGNILEILQKLPEFAVYLVAFNLLLGGLSSALNLIKDKTESSLDNKLASGVGALSGLLLKLIDLLGGNKEHK